ncbi:STAS/SEC14 domain-containing protein [Stieleria sp. TO1_6]|uniref:STAS/SEC14 domain-containing protein n=1 Tax=Stieleria tagensis TaxID=2956795 RepID=UPI00209B07C7|nr:STAS/SEC14 domain-containing protein [Stieleria tagensis]MCO8121124.1 STAS/SEC14 domain-containing protein [Stieleria tagensis]
MIEQIKDLPPATLGFRFTGKVESSDYESVLTPAIDQAILEHDQIKLLCQFGTEFEGYSLAAAWDDAKLGLRHWSGFERVAVVTDLRWIRTCVGAMGVLVRCPVELFGDDQVDEAKRWLEESLGSIHLDQAGDVVTVKLLGKLEPSAYHGVNDEISNLMGRTNHLRLLLDLREFDGWTGLAALGDHLSIVREHYRAPEKVAVIGDKNWQKLARKVMSKFVNAETKYFEAAESAAAKTWVAA